MLRDLDSFQYIAITDNVTKNNLVHLHIVMHFHSFGGTALGYIPRSGTAALKGKCTCSLIKNIFTFPSIGLGHFVFYILIFSHQPCQREACFSSACPIE